LHHPELHLLQAQRADAVHLVGGGGRLEGRGRPQARAAGGAEDAPHLDAAQRQVTSPQRRRGIHVVQVADEVAGEGEVTGDGARGQVAQPRGRGGVHRLPHGGQPVELPLHGREGVRPHAQGEGIRHPGVAPQGALGGQGDPGGRAVQRIHAHPVAGGVQCQRQGQRRAAQGRLLPDRRLQGTGHR
jgi:hypothetical protein